MGEEGGIAHVSPRRKLDTDWRFSTTTTTVAEVGGGGDGALTLSPLLSPPSFRAEPGYYPPLQREGGREGRRAGFGAKRNGGEGERVKCSVLAGRKSAGDGETQTVPDQNYDGILGRRKRRKKWDNAAVLKTVCFIALLHMTCVSGRAAQVSRGSVWRSKGAGTAIGEEEGWDFGAQRRRKRAADAAPLSFSSQMTDRKTNSPSTFQDRSLK